MRAQSTPDSVAIWTSQLERGTDASRAEALAQLSVSGCASRDWATRRSLLSGT